MMNPICKTLLTACLLAVSPAFGATPVAEHLLVSGFGTLGVAQTDSDEFLYVRRGQSEGAPDSADFNLDSNLGVQAIWQPVSWISGTAQLLAMHRAEPNIDVEVEWAFVKLEPFDRFALRAGRMQLPMFAISDVRNVGYAHTWARPPDELYGLALLERVEGADASYRLPLGGGSLSLTMVGGKSFFVAYGFRTEVSDVRGANAQWEWNGLTLRVGRVQGDVEISIGTAAGSFDPYTFTGFGASFDRNDIVVQAEYGMRRSEMLPSVIDADGWYVLAGRRFGAVLPYVIYGDSKPVHVDGDPSLRFSGRQSTTALGVRWDAFASAAIKLQIQQVDAHGSGGISFNPFEISPVPLLTIPVNGVVNVASLNVDFVF